jgi:hypothetical protein
LGISQLREEIPALPALTQEVSQQNITGDRPPLILNGGENITTLMRHQRWY